MGRVGYAGFTFFRSPSPSPVYNGPRYKFPVIPPFPAPPVPWLTTPVLWTTSFTLPPQGPSSTRGSSRNLRSVAPSLGDNSTLPSRCPQSKLSEHLSNSRAIDTSLRQVYAGIQVRSDQLFFLSFVGLVDRVISGTSGGQTGPSTSMFLTSTVLLTTL